MRYQGILETIGRTPVTRLNRLAPAHVNLYVKLEAFNPMGSVKDRLALGVIERAEHEGLLQPGQTVVEATSGNTGIGLAMVCAAKGYPLVVTMAENFSVERRRLMRFLGARVVLTPAAQKGSGMLAKACELAKKHGWFLVRQFENEANADVHSRTTALEILEDFRGDRLDAWVTGYGSGGTLKGVGRVLRAQRPETRIFVCEPDNSQVLGSGIAQARAADGSPAASHPVFRPHAMQGWAPDFIPKLAEDAIEQGLIDRVVPVNGALALDLARRLATEEGILAGISGGATLAGAIEICRDLPASANVLCMLPDTGERYLSTPLFADVPAEMTDEEIELSRSTPGFRFDTPARPPVPDAPPAVPASPVMVEERDFVEQAVADREQPVLMFALEWCEFCWSVRRLFARLRIRYRAVDLDSVEMQREDRGGRIRAALAARTSVATIPQIFIGGEFIGGCTELFDAWRGGRAQQLLERCGVDYDRSAKIDPYTFLPAWLHPR
ncbi:MAG TPA: cysteine synthase A [Steroidobacteraceae bacterium]|nr:cysteine synthase A [Steroidobacteraceae bacterium]